MKPFIFLSVIVAVIASIGASYCCCTTTILFAGLFGAYFAYSSSGGGTATPPAKETPSSPKSTLEALVSKPKKLPPKDETPVPETSPEEDHEPKKETDKPPSAQDKEIPSEVLIVDTTHMFSGNQLDAPVQQESHALPQHERNDNPTHEDLNNGTDDDEPEPEPVLSEPSPASTPSVTTISTPTAPTTTNDPVIDNINNDDDENEANNNESTSVTTLGDSQDLGMTQSQIIPKQSDDKQNTCDTEWTMIDNSNSETGQQGPDSTHKELASSPASPVMPVVMPVSSPVPTEAVPAAAGALPADEDQQATPVSPGASVVPKPRLTPRKPSFFERVLS